jgi:hypothetical protein
MSGVMRAHGCLTVDEKGKKRNEGSCLLQRTAKLNWSSWGTVACRASYILMKYTNQAHSRLACTTGMLYLSVGNNFSIPTVVLDPNSGQDSCP